MGRKENIVRWIELPKPVMEKIAREAERSSRTQKRQIEFIIKEHVRALEESKTEYTAR